MSRRVYRWNVGLAIFFITLLTAASINVLHKNGLSTAAGTDQSVFGIGVHSTDLHDRYVTTFKLRQGTAFNPEISLFNYIQHRNVYDVIFFLDYKQIKVSYEGKLTECITKHLDPQQSITFHVGIPRLPSGNHDLICIAIKNNETPLNKQFFIPPESTYLARRVTLEVSPQTKMQYSRLGPYYVTTTKINRTAFPSDLLVLTPINKPVTLHNVVTLTNQKRFDLDYRTNGNDTTYAILVILDKIQQQHSVSHQFIHVSKSGLIHLPVKLTAPRDHRPHELAVVMIDNPYQPLIAANGSLLRDRDVHFSNKITVTN